MRRVLVLVLALASMLPASSARASVPSCSEAIGDLATGVVATTSCASDALGGITPFSYFIPSACTAGNRCPVLYLLHGFGGDYRSMLGTPGAPSAYVRALAQDPGNPLNLILIAPNGRTVAPQADGTPPPEQESFWVDWNPRYWTHPPRFEEFVTRELRDLIDRSFPTIATREGRAILGVSLGGFGSYKLAFQHPDLYANAGSVSGALNLLVAPDVQPVAAGQPGVGGAPLETTYVHGPQVVHTPPGFPFGDPFGAFGDPAFDEAYYRGNNPLDLAVNATGLGLRFFHNDTVSRDPSDVTNPASYVAAQALEDAVMPMNQEMRAALTQDGMPFEYELHPGIHSGKYWDPYIRAQLEWQYARVSHTDHALPPYAPPSFTYRSIKSDFSVWGWHVNITKRTPEEFLTLSDASRDGVTVTGSGTITIISPPIDDLAGVRVDGVPSAAISVGDRAYVQVTLGPPAPTDEHAVTSGLPGAQHSVHLCFARRGTHTCG